MLWMVLLSPFTFHLSPCLANNSLIGIGVRGGGQMFLPSAAKGSSEDMKGTIDGVGGIDLRYTFYGNLTDRIGMGGAVGAGFGYGTTTLRGSHTDQYSNIDYLNNHIDYTIDSKYILSDKFAQANASLMLALYFGHFTVNVGPRFMLPISVSSRIQIEEAHINAYFPRYDVHVKDKIITGALETPYTQSVSTNIPPYNVLIGADVGYEWVVTDKTNIGVQAFANIAVWSHPSTSNIQYSPLITVAPITDAANPIPAVSVNTVSGQIKSMRYLDFGLRAYVAFSVGKNNGFNQTRFDSRHDTKNHRNRYRWW